MQAVIETGGKQHLVKENQVLRVEKLPVEPGKDVKFTPLLIIDNNGEATIGTPTVAKGAVSAVVMEHGRGKKVRVVKYKSKVRYTRVLGHRQAYSQIKIKKIAS